MSNAFVDEAVVNDVPVIGLNMKPVDAGLKVEISGEPDAVVVLTIETFFIIDDAFSL